MEHFVHGQHTVYVITCLSFVIIKAEVEKCDHNTSTSISTRTSARVTILAL